MSIEKHKFRNDDEFDKFVGRMAEKGLTIEGAEIPDPVPMAAPVGYTRQPSMFEHMRAMVAHELAARGMGEETPEDVADMGYDEDEVAEELSQYERYDLEMELARRTDAEAREAASAASTAPPGAPPSDGPEIPPGGTVAPLVPSVALSPGKQ